MIRDPITQTIAETATIISGRQVLGHESFEALGFDSLHCIEFIVAIEDAFDIEISCAERVSLDGLADAIALVTEKTTQGIRLAA